MTKQNKVLEALQNVKKRIKTEVSTLRSPEEVEIEYYEAIGINRILLEEINKVIEAGEKTLKLKKGKPVSRRYGRGRRKRSKRLISKDQLFDEKMSYR